MYDAALRALRRIDAGSPSAADAALNVLRQAVLAGDVPPEDKAALLPLLPPKPGEAPIARTCAIRLRVTPGEAAYIRTLARREADGSLSTLIRQRLGIPEK